MIWQIVPTDSSPNCRRNALLSIGGVKTLLALFFGMVLVGTMLMLAFGNGG